MEITASAYDWVAEDSRGQLRILAWCLDRDSRPLLLRFEDFPAFCQVELPSFVRGRPMTWREESVSVLVSYLERALGADAPIRYTFALLRKVYYYRGSRRYPVVTLCFSSLEALRHCANRLSYPLSTREWGAVSCSVWEAGISPVRKLLTAKGVKYSEWFTVRGEEIGRESQTTDRGEASGAGGRESQTTDRGGASGAAEKISRGREYLAEWQSLRPTKLDVSTRPGILSFDIECYSSNPRAMPDRYDARHVAYLVTVVYQRLGDRSSRRRFAVLFGDCAPLPEEDPATVTKVGSEFAMVEEFARLVRELDPEVVIGYNILGFDYPYLHHRVRREFKEWPEMGRLIGAIPTLRTSEWKSEAYGHNSLSLLQMAGRISLDLLPLVRREFPRFDRYDLDSVARKLVGRGKCDVKAPHMFAVFEALQREKTPEVLGEMARIVEYGIRDSELVLDLFERLNVWIGSVELSNIMGVSLVDLYVRGQQIRCFSQLYNLAAAQGVVLDEREAPRSSFGGGFVFDPVPGLHDNIICLDFASLYPSIIQAYNICYTTLLPPELDKEVPDELCWVIDFQEEEEEEEEDLPDLAPKKKGKKRLVSHRFRFLKEPQGLLPRLVRELVEERRAVNRQIAEQKKKLEALSPASSEAADLSLLITILDKRQLGLKVSANSFFGFLGIREGGMMPLLEGAMSITAVGRRLIGQVRDYLAERYGASLVAGDTDSAMADLGISDPKLCAYWGLRLSQEINGLKKGERDADGRLQEEDRPGLFPPPLKIEYEKAMRILCLKKKRYAALLLEKDGSFKREPVVRDGKVVGTRLAVLKRGITTARRDNALVVRELVDRLLEHIMQKGPLVEAVDMVVDVVRDTYSGLLPLEKFLLVRGLGANYTNENFSLKIFAEELRRQGKTVNPGDRLEFVLVADPSARLLGNKMRLKESFLEEGRGEQIDFDYYVEKLMATSINQLFEIAYREEIDRLSAIRWRPSNRHKFIGLEKIVKLLVAMHRAGLDLDHLKKAVRANLERPRRVRLVVAPPKVPTRVVPKLPPRTSSSARSSLPSPP